MSSLAADCAVAFFGGALSEGVCVFWVAASQRGRAVVAAAFSALYAVAIERGIGEAIHGWPREAFFVSGFAVGTWCAVRLKSLLVKSG